MFFFRIDNIQECSVSVGITGEPTKKSHFGRAATLKTEFDPVHWEKVEAQISKAVIGIGMGLFEPTTNLGTAFC